MAITLPSIQWPWRNPAPSKRRPSNIIGWRPVVFWAPIFKEAWGKNAKGWPKQRMRVLVRDNFHCQVKDCRETQLNRLTVHHLRPRCQGGGDNMSNLITLCQRHHRWLHEVQQEEGAKYVNLLSIR